MKFTVLMSVYYKEVPYLLDQSLRSLFYNQSLIPDEVVLVKDGPLTDELESVIKKYEVEFSKNLKIVGLDQNQGLGRALNIGLDYCSNELVARMDSDDISAVHRFDKQLQCFKLNNKIDVVGGYISEFYDTPEQPVATRKVPNQMKEIIEMMKRRNPINHVTVMFKKNAVLRAGGYMHLPFLEDYYLWIRMVENGSEFMNLDDVLVYVRTGKEMYKRRSDRRYLKGWFILQRKMKEMHLISFFNMPTWLKEISYKKFLRS
jgi:glycosyltransferase involved in cell wall biosynthesis